MTSSPLPTHRGDAAQPPARRSLLRTVLLFLGIYFVFQPACIWLFSRLIPLYPPFAPETWSRLIPVLAVVASIAGLLWWGSLVLAAARVRLWLRTLSGALAFCTILFAHELSNLSSGQWLLVLCVTAVPVAGLQVILNSAFARGGSGDRTA